MKHHLKTALWMAAAAGPLVAAVVLAQMRRDAKWRVANTKMTIRTVSHALYRYQDDIERRCPNSIDVLYDNGYLNKEPLDSWGRKLRLVCPRTDHAEDFDIESAGADGIFDTDDDLRVP
jgi:hypothetical protein